MLAVIVGGTLSVVALSSGLLLCMRGVRMYAICHARGAWVSHKHSQGRTVVLARDS